MLVQFRDVLVEIDTVEYQTTESDADIIIVELFQIDETKKTNRINSDYIFESTCDKLLNDSAFIELVNHETTKQIEGTRWEVGEKINFV